MIKNLAVKIVNTYDNLSPSRKALADILGVMFGVVLGASVLVVAVQFNLLLEVALLMMAYGLGGMVVAIYNARVAHYEFQEKYNKK